MPDITNDFDNNPNTDKRKQRDEEVNNDNLQPEQKFTGNIYSDKACKKC